MDNCRTHHVAVSVDLVSIELYLIYIQGVFEACNEFNVLLLYLPPYSPDYNPIEPSFHLLKQWQRRHASISPIYGEDQYTEKFEAFLFASVREFGHGVNWQALFRQAGVCVNNNI